MTGKKIGLSIVITFASILTPAGLTGCAQLTAEIERSLAALESENGPYEDWDSPFPELSRYDDREAPGSTTRPHKTSKYASRLSDRSWEQSWESPRPTRSRRVASGRQGFFTRYEEVPELDEPAETKAAADIMLGMGMTEVRGVWGDPRDVESAGDPRWGNQRWIYTDGLSSSMSLSAKKIVYFEGGRVIGWETIKP